MKISRQALARFLKAGILGILVSAGLWACKKGEVETRSNSEVTVGDFSDYNFEGSALEVLQKSMDFAAASKGDGDPAIWKLSDEDTDIYILGTIHLLPDGINWETQLLDRITAQMDTLYLETDTESRSAQLETDRLLRAAAVFEPGNSLKAVLGDDYAKVQKAAATVGLDLAEADEIKPWMIGLQVAIEKMMGVGFDPAAGVETVLVERAEKNNIRLAYLESGADQISAISGGSIDDQVKSLVQMAETIDASERYMDAMVSEWVDGDVYGLGAMVANPSTSSTQGYYDRVLKNRNENWIPKIIDILNHPGVKLVAVGAGHLAGPDSVIIMLENEGFEVQVVQ